MLTTTSYLAPLGKPRSSPYLRKYASSLDAGGLRPTRTQSSGELERRDPESDGPAQKGAIYRGKTAYALTNSGEAGSLCSGEEGQPGCGQGRSSGRRLARPDFPLRTNLFAAAFLGAAGRPSRQELSRLTSCPDAVDLPRRRRVRPSAQSGPHGVMAAPIDPLSPVLATGTVPSLTRSTTASACSLIR